MMIQPIENNPLYAEEAERICKRVINALIREDVAGFYRGAEILAESQATFFKQATEDSQGVSWLRISHIGPGRFWIAVQKTGFMQDWCVQSLPVYWESAGQVNPLFQIETILILLGDGLTGGVQERLTAFVRECQAAIEHAVYCRQEQQRYFQACRAGARQFNGEQPGVDATQHYERLSAFLDHPLYPTARAKLGFTEYDLRRYGPEFQAGFSLRWLAVPKHLCVLQGDGPAKWRPGFEQVGLPNCLSDSHCLIPVHPFMWGQQLDRLLTESQLREQVIKAPGAYLHVIPTLSVRTVQCQASNLTHIKLPLPIRTLGGMNIRTIKPSTIHDGHLMQQVLEQIVRNEPSLCERVVFADEAEGAHVGHQDFLGYIVRRYPATVEQGTSVPVAGLLAETPEGKRVIEQLAERFYQGRVENFLDDYLALTLRLHLLLWVKYAIALESNQQNSVIVLDSNGMRLLLKDNDAPRVYLTRLAELEPTLAERLQALQDRRILVDSETPLLQMFTTITLQLNIASILEGLAQSGRYRIESLYRSVTDKIVEILAELRAQGAQTDSVETGLLQADRHYLKLLLTSATLKSKADTGALDVNKYYGNSAPNVLRQS